MSQHTPSDEASRAAAPAVSAREVDIAMQDLHDMVNAAAAVLRDQGREALAQRLEDAAVSADRIARARCAELESVVGAAAAPQPAPVAPQATEGGELLTPTIRLAIADAVRKAFPHVTVPHNVYDQIAWNTEQACYAAVAWLFPTQIAGENQSFDLAAAQRKLAAAQEEARAAENSMLRTASQIDGTQIGWTREKAIALAKQCGASYYRRFTGTEGVQFEGGSLAAFIKAIAVPAALRTAPVAAWMTEDGERVVSNATKVGLERDGGGSASAMEPYSVPLVRADGTAGAGSAEESLATRPAPP